jgi:hypothetical protein
VLRLRVTATQRGRGELDVTELEEAPVAVEVTEPAAQQQEAAESQHVRIDHPDQRSPGEMQVLADGRQRDVHDGRVEHDHEHAGTQHVQRPPAAPGIFEHGSSLGTGVTRPCRFRGHPIDRRRTIFQRWIASIFAAQMKSFSCNPPIACVW